MRGGAGAGAGAPGPLKMSCGGGGGGGGGAADANVGCRTAQMATHVAMSFEIQYLMFIMLSV